MEGEIAENRIVVNVKPQTQTDASNVPYLLSFQSATEMSRIETSSGIYLDRFPAKFGQNSLFPFRQTPMAGQSYSNIYYQESINDCKTFLTWLDWSTNIGKMIRNTFSTLSRCILLKVTGYGSFRPT